MLFEGVIFNKFCERYFGWTFICNMNFSNRSICIFLWSFAPSRYRPYYLILFKFRSILCTQYRFTVVSLNLNVSTLWWWRGFFLIIMIMHFQMFFDFYLYLLLWNFQLIRQIFHRFNVKIKIIYAIFLCIRHFSFTWCSSLFKLTHIHI